MIIYGSGKVLILICSAHTTTLHVRVEFSEQFQYEEKEESNELNGEVVVMLLLILITVLTIAYSLFRSLRVTCKQRVLLVQ